MITQNHQSPVRAFSGPATARARWSGYVASSEEQQNDWEAF